jgi:hypothetical protein
MTLGDQITDSLGEVIVDIPVPRPWQLRVGELRLMAAVLEDAIHVLRKRPRSRAGREAREWLHSNDRSWPFAYERICEALDLDADQVRNRIANSGTIVRFPIPTLQPFNFAQSA